MPLRSDASASEASAIEASHIAGRSGLNMTNSYTFVTSERQNELTLRIERRLAEAAKMPASHAAAGSASRFHARTAYVQNGARGIAGYVYTSRSLCPSQ